MKRIILLLFLCQAAFAQVPSDWDVNPPRDTEQYKFAVGVSLPSATEQDALKNALQNAIQQFASSIATRFQGQTDITVQSQSFSSGIEDAYTVYMETSSFSASVPISGVAERARKVETANGRYIARILAAMTVEDYNKAKQFVENEEASSLAYRFFAEKKLFPAAVGQKPDGFDDYYSWLRNNCIVVSFDSPNDDPNLNAMLGQIDLLINKLYKNAVVFAQIINGRGARIVYNSSRYYDGLLRALQNTALFTIQRESSHLTLHPVRANILGELRTVVSGVKDSGKFVITGLEVIQTSGGETVNQGAIIINQFKTIAARQFNMQAVNYAIPAQFLSGYVDEDAILRHVQNDIVAFPARYLVVCHSETRLEKGMAEYNIPPIITASCRFSLYDTVTGETLQSGTVETGSGGFSTMDLADRAVIEESRRALQFLYNAKTHPGLEDVMQDVFGNL